MTDKELKEIAEFLDCGHIVYIHKETQRIIALPDFDEYSDFEFEDDDEEANEIEENAQNYYSIEKMESSDFYRVMADFAENIPSTKDRHFFVNVLDGKKPMANFNHHIHNSNYREEWFAHKNQAYIDYAKKEIDWLFRKRSNEDD